MSVVIEGVVKDGTIAVDLPDGTVVKILRRPDITPDFASVDAYLSSWREANPDKLLSGEQIDARMRELRDHD